ncbi:chromosomal replication initiator protein DnaA, partial [Candidatus Parcubacteria bacterium]|nr:chromosomal replication initiator protein DnaA [Candidatus Parcubacteria bacterium]
RPPNALPAIEKRIVSRFNWGMVADVIRPDIETRMAILTSKCEERNYNIEDKILNYLAENVQNNIRDLEGALNRLIAYHEFNNSQPNIETTKSILSGIISNYQSKTTSPKTIIDAALKFYDVALKDLIGKSRKKELVVPRQIVMYLMREEINTSYPTIGHELGGRDHTTAMHAFNKISKSIIQDDRIKQEVNSIKQLIQNGC